MAHMKLKRRFKRNHWLSPLLIIITIVIIVAILGIRYMGNVGTPILLSFAEMKVKKLGNLVINRTISNEVISKLDMNDLFDTVYNNNREIVSIDFNPVIVNKVLNEAAIIILQNLKAIEEGNLHLIDGAEVIFSDYDLHNLKRGIVYEIPLGIISNMPLLANVGPKIPIRFALVGNLNTNFYTRVRNYGINNIMVEAVIKVDVTNQVILPLMSKTIQYDLEMPVATKIMPGEIPKYYQQGFSQSSPIFTIPMD